MSSTCCRTCDHRNHAVNSRPSPPSQLDVCIVALSFKGNITFTTTKQYTALNTLLNDIIDHEETVSNPSTFTVWSPCSSDPKTAVIVTTVGEIFSTATGPIFDGIRQHLTRPPTVQHIYLDMAVVSLAASSPSQRVCCDVLQLHAPNSDVAVAVGKMFGWDPTRSSLSSRLQSRGAAAFSRPGDLIRDFWAWAEMPFARARSLSGSTGSYETLAASPPLISTNSDEKNMSLVFPCEMDEPPPYTDDETLVMIFQWDSRVAGDRFKDPERKSYGLNGEEVRRDLWDRDVALPIDALQRIGTRIDTYDLELRAVEPRLSVGSMAAGEAPAARARSGSKRLSIMASELGDKVSGLWR